MVLVLGQVEITACGNPFQLMLTKGKLEGYVRTCLSVMSKVFSCG